MLEYMEHTVAPYVEKAQESLAHDTPALVILDNFKGQVTENILSLIEDHKIQVCFWKGKTPVILMQPNYSQSTWACRP